MRYFIAASLLVAGTLAQLTDDYLKCAVRTNPQP